MLSNTDLNDLRPLFHNTNLSCSEVLNILHKLIDEYYKDPINVDIQLTSLYHATERDSKPL